MTPSADAGSGPPLVVDAFGAAWALDVDGAGHPLGPHLRRLWARAASGPTTGEVLPWVVGRDDEGRVVLDGAAHRLEDDDVPYTVSRSLTHASIRRRAGHDLMLHAAGLADPDGAVLALVAPSGTGKTTAARVLGRRLGYVTDETVAVRADGSVAPWAKPLSVVVDPGRPHDKVERSPDELGLVAAPSTLHLGAVVVLCRDPDAASPRLEPTTLVEALDAVLPQTSSLLRLPRPLDRLAEALTRSGGPWRLTYAEIGDCLDLLTGLLGGSGAAGSPADVVTWSTVRGSAPASDEDTEVFRDPEPSEGAAGAGSVAGDVGAGWTTVRRSEFQHALTSEGVTLVLRGHLPATLPGLASPVWLAADRPSTLADLVVAAEAALGPHPESVELVRRTVSALLAADLLEVVEP